MRFYTWGDAGCCLAAGATRRRWSGTSTALHVGDVLLFEEVLGPRTGAPEDADRTRRWVVRLTRVHHTDRFGHALTDPVSMPTPNAQITGIAWDAADALPFPLCISSTTDAAHGARRGRQRQRRARQHRAGRPWTVDRRLRRRWARCRLRRRRRSALAGGCCVATAAGGGQAAGLLPGAQCRRRSPSRRPYDPAAPASALTRPPDPRCAAAAAADQRARRPRQRLVARGRPARARSAATRLRAGDRARRHRLLRFGDGEYGTAPEPRRCVPGVLPHRQRQRRQYRPRHAGPCAHHQHARGRRCAIRCPPRGGRDPETMEQIRQRAPWAFRTQLRAVTEDDYGVAALRDRGDPRRARHAALDRQLAHRIRGARSGSRRATAGRTHAGRRCSGSSCCAWPASTSAAEPAFIVGLRVALSICVKPRYARGRCAAGAAQVIFTAGPTCDGTPGLLDPENFSFGQTVYLSPFIAAAQAVEGVASVQATAFQRVDDPARDAVAARLHHHAAAGDRPDRQRSEPARPRHLRAHAGRRAMSDTDTTALRLLHRHHARRRRCRSGTGQACRRSPIASARMRASRRACSPRCPIRPSRRWRRWPRATTATSRSRCSTRSRSPPTS